MLSSVRRISVAALTAVIVTVGVSAAVSADEGAIAHRKAIMTAIVGHVKATAAIVKKQVPFTEDLKGHAHALYELAKINAKVFPQGSGSGDTGALPAIWEKPAEFKAAVKAFETAAGNLAKAADGGDMGTFMEAFGGLGKSCKGCHSEFRKK